MDNHLDVVSTNGVLPLRLKNAYKCQLESMSCVSTITASPYNHSSFVAVTVPSKSTAPAANIATLNNTIPYFVTSYRTLYCN